MNKKNNMFKTWDVNNNGDSGGSDQGRRNKASRIFSMSKNKVVMCSFYTHK